MNKLDQLKQQYSEEINKSLKLNKSKIIDSFVEYYGEEYRDIIEKRYDEIVFTYFINPDYISILCKKRLYDMQKYYTEKVLNNLGFNITSLNTDYILGNVIKDSNGDVKIFSSKITKVFNDGLDINLMKFIFGENGLFYTKEQDFSINLFKDYTFGNELNKNQKEFLKYVFNTDELTFELFNNIKNNIDIIRKYILDYKKFEEESKKYYILFLIKKYYEKYKVGSKIKSIFFKGLTNYYLKHVGSSDEFKVSDYELESFLEDNYDFGVPFQSGKEKNGVYLRLVSFSIILSGDIELFHEIGHALTDGDNLCEITYNDDSSEKISKRGLCVTDKNNMKKTIALEEIINEKVTLDVIEIFKQREGNVLNSPLTVEIKNKYIKYYYSFAFFLVNRFYDEFKEEIKKARITDNNYELILMCGKENYDALSNIVSKILDKIKEKWNLFNASDYEFLLDEVNLIVDAMIINRDKQHIFSDTELNEYYDNLRNQGYQVTEIKDNEKEMKR